MIHKFLEILIYIAMFASFIYAAYWFGMALLSI